jgi:hypothetical protein
MFPERMNALYSVGAFKLKNTPTLYVMFCLKVTNCFQFTFTLIINQLFNIIEQFCDITCLQQIFGMIDDTHIPLNVKPNKQIASSIIYFYNRKCFHSILLQVVHDCDLFFWNACVHQPSGVANKGQFKMSIVYHCL